MKNFLLLLLVLVAFQCQAGDAYLGKTQEQIIKSVNSTETSIYNKGKQSFIVSKISKEGTLVCYFERNVCTNYNIVWFSLTLKDISSSFDQQYVKKGNRWMMSEEKAYITAYEAAGSVFVNVVKL